MRTLIIVFVATCLSGNLAAQSIERQVISAFGFSYSGATLQQDCTVGEVVIATGQGAGLSITQGFHQPLLVITSCAGDFDNNGVINVSDLLIFSGAFGCNVSCGLPDMDGNGAVNVGDLLLFLAVFGTVCP